MDLELAARVRASIAEQARAEGVPAGIRQVCGACLRDLDGDGVSVCLRGPDDTYEMLHATGPRMAELAELEITLGEGPGRDALARGRPILVPDLGSDDVQRRWPMLARGALDVVALFAIPMQVGVIAVGTLTIVRTKPGWLSAPELTMALLYADAALVMALSNDQAPGHVTDGSIPGVNGFVDRWAQVHQATGMVSAQLGTSIAEAFVRLRAHAFASERSLTTVADDVVARRLRFSPEEGPR